jgi:hypothetical protein
MEGGRKVTLQNFASYESAIAVAHWYMIFRHLFATGNS